MVSVVFRFIFRPSLVLIGADLDVDGLNVTDTGLQFVGSLVQKVDGVPLSRLAVGAEGFVPLLQQDQLPAHPVLLHRQLSGPFPLTLVLAVPGKDILLALNEVIGRNRLGGGLWVAGQLLGVLSFLVGDLANGPALVIQLLLLPFQLPHLLLQADDSQEGGGLLPAGGLHEPGHVQG